jgi:hypothetical protein
MWRRKRGPARGGNRDGSFAVELFGTDVAAIDLGRALDLFADGVGGVGGGAEGGRGGGDAEDATAGGDDLAGGVVGGAGVDDLDVGRKRGRERDDVAFGIGVGVALGGDDDADGVVGFDGEADAGEGALGGGPEEGEDIGVEARDDDLGFGVAEAGVVFEHAGAGGREHDADEERAAEIDTLVGDGVDGRFHDFLLDLGEQRGGDDVGGGVGAHAAGVGAGIPVADTFVVLRGGEDDVVSSGGDDEDGGFFAEHAVFDENLAARGAEFVAGEHVLDGGFGFGEGLGDDHAFAGGESVGFDYDGGAALADVGEGGFDLGEDARGGGGDAVFEENLFGENLGGFEAGTIGFGAVGGDADFGEGVHEAEGERDLGTDDDEVDFLALDEGDETGDVVGGNGESRDLGGDAGVAGSGDHAGAGGGGEDGFDERVLAAAGADDEDVFGKLGGRVSCGRHGGKENE